MDVTCFAVPTPTSGVLWVMPCPTPDQLNALQGLGVHTVLSMLPKPEAQVLGMQDEAELCVAHGMQFLAHPIPDYGLPDLAVFPQLIAEIATRLQRAQSVAVHCRAGIGRTGMVAACTLVALGETTENAIKRVSDARGVSIPDTIEQGKFIASFAELASKDTYVRY